MGAPENAGECLPNLLAEQALIRPNDIAVVQGGDSLTYRELVDGSIDLAVYLQRLGVSTDACVGVLVDPSIELMIGVWGILHSGGAYLPLSPDYPDDRLRYMIEDSGISVVFTQEELRPRLAGIAPPGMRIITLDDVAEFMKARGEDIGSTLSTGPRPEGVAYVIYTSGSTGKPKGVMIEHRSIVHQLRWFATAFGLGSDQVVLQKTPMSFDAAQWEILASVWGSRVVIGESGIHRDPSRLIETIAEHRVTTLQCVPTLLKALLDTEEIERCTTLTHVFSGGEALSRALARQCTQTLPDCELVNLYGPTECTINASAFTVDRATLGYGPQSVPIGAPVAGTRFHVLDADRRPLGVGETGELHISGIQLARGYLHRPELTTDRFIASPFGEPAPHDRLYRTGDLAHWNADGTVQFVGRADNQVKLRGFRVELDEIRLAIEAHDWVKNAAVLVRDDPRTGFQNLVACIELSPREAVLMDQGAHGAHHLSKESRLQVRAQLSNAGTRTDGDLAGRPAVGLPGAASTARQRRRAFARKTYRFYEGGTAEVRDILDALAHRPAAAGRRRPEDLSLDELGAVLRNFGPFTSRERLLPKYAYASPGSLYATQLYVEVSGGVAGLLPGVYYHHPQRHQLILVRDREDTGAADGPAGVTLHFVGHRRAIEPVYKNNIQEVLEIETGHMLGLLDEILPEYGLSLGERPFTPGVRHRLGCAQDDHYLGSFALVPYTETAYLDEVDVYVQIHPGSAMDLPPGQYLHRDGRLERVSDDLVLKRHVIAINQQVYERASFGITVVSRTKEDWRRYVDLGRTLQHLQLGAVRCPRPDTGRCGQPSTGRLGFMSAGYSSRTGHDLPAARRMAAILEDSGLPTGPSYFFVGGRVSDEQLSHEGMNEDAVHMKGPAEMIKDDLVGFLPEFMLPNQVLVLEQLPHTANGKLDNRALAAHVDAAMALDDRPVVPPRTRTEARLADLWKAALKRDVVSVQDDFFACGGNSLIAVSLVNRINRELGNSLPLQVFFESPTVEKLALRVDATGARTDSRLVTLRSEGEGRAGERRLEGEGRAEGDGLGAGNGLVADDGLLAGNGLGADGRAEGDGHPVFCWPGLGGYAMNLRLLAARTAGLPGQDRPFYGIQALGLNDGETPSTGLEEMAATDVRAIRRVQRTGPYTLWGYSFGARVAFEAARQLERAGEEVQQLLLLAPGSPRVTGPESWTVPAADFTDDTFRTILFSVFAGATSGPLLAECLRDAVDEESFTRFVIRRFRRLDPGTVRRIVRVACRTYGWHPAPHRIAAPITILKARGDEESFLERAPAHALTTPTVVELDTDHYGLLRDPGVDELMKVIQRETRTR